MAAPTLRDAMLQRRLNSNLNSKRENTISNIEYTGYHWTGDCGGISAKEQENALQGSNSYPGILPYPTNL